MYKIAYFLILILTISSCYSKKDNSINNLLIYKLLFSSEKDSFEPNILLDMGNGFEPQIKGVLSFQTDKQSLVSKLTSSSAYQSVRNIDSLKDKKIKVEENTNLSFAIYNGTQTVKVFSIGKTVNIKSKGGTLKNPTIADIFPNEVNRNKFITLIANVSKDTGKGYIIDTNQFEQLQANWTKIKENIESSTIGLDTFLKKQEFNKVITGDKNATALTDVTAVKATGKTLIDAQEKTTQNVKAAVIADLSFDSAVRSMSYLTGMPDALEQPKELEQVGSPTENKSPDGKTVEVCTVKKYKAAPGFNELSVMDPTTDVIWPGALIQGDTITNGKYISIQDARAPLTLSASLQNNNKVAQYIENPALSSFRTARNAIVGAGGNAPLNISYTIEEVHSSEQLGLAIGANFSKKGPIYSGSVAASFNFNKSDVKSRFVVKYIQKYYTIDIDLPAYPSSFFKNPSSVQTDTWGISPMYVSTVAYGRMILFTVESTKSSQEVKAALTATFRSKLAGASGGVSVSSNYQKTLDNSTTKAFILGGGGKTGDTGNSSTNILDFNGIKNLINEGVNYSSSTPGAPISYKLRYLKDNSIGNIVLSSEYNVRNCVVKKTGKRVFKLEVDRIYVGDVYSDGGDLEFDIAIDFNKYINNSSSVEWPDSGGNRVYRAYKYPSVDIGSAYYPSGTDRLFTFQINNENDLKVNGLRIYADVRDWDKSSSNDIIQIRAERFSLKRLLENPMFKVRHSSSEGYVDIHYKFSEQ